MKELLKNEAYSFVNEKDKAFIVAFDEEMTRLGYTSGGTIGEGYCWGRKMIIYTKANVKSKKSYARVYLQEAGLVLRMYFSRVDDHAAAIEAAPAYVQAAFTSGFGACGHCHNQKADGSCGHRKAYTLHGKPYALCDGFAFWFNQPTVCQIPAYVQLFLAFYPEKKRRTNLKR